MSPAQAVRRKQRRHLLRGLALPLVLLLLFGAVGNYALINRSAGDVQMLTDSQEHRLVSSSLKRGLQKFQRFASDYGYWDEFYKAFEGTPDPAWVDPDGVYLGNYLAEAYDVTAAFVFRSSGGFVYAWNKYAAPGDDVMAMAGDPQIRQLVGAALAAPDHSAAIGVSGFVKIDGVLYFAAAGRIHPTSEDLRAGMRGKRSVFIVLSDISGPQLSVLGEDFGVNGLQLTGDRPKSGPYVEVVDNFGAPLGNLVWQRVKSNETVIASYIPSALVMLGLMLAAAALLIWRWVSFVDSYQNIALAADAAEAASQAKSAFISNMSHELRTPLNAIIGFSEVMAGEMFGPHSVPKYKAYAQDINTSGQHLLHVVNDILSIAKIEAQQYPLSIGPVDLFTEATAAAKIASADAEKRGVHIAVKTPDRPVFANADARAVRQIAINLLSNAIKFSNKGSAVDIGWREAGHGRQIEIYVQDRGAGIPKDKLPLIGTPFFQVADVMARNTGGIGLGMSIVKGLISAMDGQFAIESELGKGTTVRVRLPLAAAPAALPEKRAA